ncbi:MAG TPA: hypothetical protein VMD25_01490 [Acidobacteriaceae bacterium]|nr:hypothetical protein [Acidobacteriaceae bacterium]
MLSLDELPLIGLAVVVAFGIGFLLWTLAHMVGEMHPHGEGLVRLFRPVRSRRHV